MLNHELAYDPMFQSNVTNQLLVAHIGFGLKLSCLFFLQLLDVTELVRSCCQFLVLGGLKNRVTLESLAQGTHLTANWYRGIVTSDHCHSCAFKTLSLVTKDFTTYQGFNSNSSVQFDPPHTHARAVGLKKAKLYILTNYICISHTF